jgi:uncharacterized protein YndB with AHSA1/START domain
MPPRGSGKLNVTLPSDLEIVLSRTFDAPRHLVFEAMTKPEYVRRWYCSFPDHTMPICEMDVRVGGKWRFVLVGPEGGEVAFYGEYLEIRPPERVVNTEYFAPFPDERTVCTVTLEERGGRTEYRCHIVHTTKEGRDGHLNSGMEHGADFVFDHLEKVAQSLAVQGTARSPSTSVAPSS